MKRAAEGPAELRPSKWTRIDQGEGKPSYFVNDETNETTWTLPQGSHAKPPKAKTVIAPQAVDIYQQALQQQNMLRVQAEAAQRQALVRQGAVVDVWKCVPQVGPGKPPYYVNSKTGERAWSVPSGAQVAPWSDAARGKRLLDKVHAGSRTRRASSGLLLPSATRRGRPF